MDRVVPLSEGVELAERIRDTRFRVLDSSNHILLGDEPAFQEFINGAKAFAHEVMDTPASFPPTGARVGRRPSSAPTSSARMRSTTGFPNGL